MTHYRTFFDFSTGLAKPIRVPAGTKARIATHVAHVEETLGLVPESSGNPPRLSWPWAPAYQDINSVALGIAVEEHNGWVLAMWNLIGEHVEPRPGTETEEITPADAETFWHALRRLTVPLDLWSEEHYRDRMEHLYEVLRGRESEGVRLGVARLSTRQAAAVIALFGNFLDPGDARLDVPVGHDRLASSSDGGYDWCDVCFKPWAIEDIGDCPRKKCGLAEPDGDA